MAAYASIMSLLHTMDQVHQYAQHLISLDKYQIESLHDHLKFLQDYLEKYSHGVGDEVELLETQIATAAYAAEDAFESHVLANSKKPSSVLSWDLDEIIGQFDSIKKKIVGIREKTISAVVKQPNFSSVVPSSSKPMESRVVGFDKEVIRVMERLTNHEPERKIIPIVGMAGIGKTTLAQSAYENRTVIDYFDIRAWVTISQNYSTRSIFLDVLSYLRKLEGDESIAALSRDVDGKSEEELKLVVYQSLIARRYLIVMDDMWSLDAWDEIKFHFPNDMNKSRIIITTRHSNVASRLSSDNGGLTLNLLEDDRSWELFREKVFGREHCPYELEAIGKKIVGKCKGLPLTISVIGRFLAKSNKTVEHWEKVAEETNSILNSGDEEKDYLNILNLSYSYLPAHLKPCFLYMGIFPEDHEIPISRLVKLWIAEGFLKPIKGKNLKQVALCYIEDLVDRNLILVRRWGSNGKIRTCTIHDSLSDLCLRISRKQGFHSVLRLLSPGNPQLMEKDRRVVINPSVMGMNINSEIYDSLDSVSSFRSLICNVETNDDRWSCTSRLLRVLSWVGRYSSENLFELSNLRYLSCIPSKILDSILPSTISQFWNVQTLDFRGYWEQIVVPPEIWKMSQLRHVEFDEVSIPDPPIENGKDDLVLENLSTLLNVANFRCSNEVLKRMPNIRKLHLIYDDFSGINETGSEYCLKNLRNLTNLESLSCSFRKMPVSRDLLQNIRFPDHLNKLTLKGCMIPWEDLTIIGSLRHLEVLKLETDSVTGSEWNPVEGEFQSLKFLKICFCNLENWNAEEGHFPVLESLVLEYLYYLNEIPYAIGDITALRKIQVTYCSESTVSSGERILEEQRENGNMDIQLHVKSSETADVASLQYGDLSPGFSVIQELGDLFATF